MYSLRLKEESFSLYLTVSPAGSIVKKSARGENQGQKVRSSGDFIKDFAQDYRPGIEKEVWHDATGSWYIRSVAEPAISGTLEKRPELRTIFGKVDKEEQPSR
jgi:hypothetical protein